MSNTFPWLSSIRNIKSLTKSKLLLQKEEGANSKKNEKPVKIQAQRRVWGSRQDGTPLNKNNAATLQIAAYRHDLVWPVGLKYRP